MFDLIHPRPQWLWTCLIVCLVFLPNSLGAVSPAKAPVLLDTDIGGDIELQGITTVDGDAYTRALILCRLLHAIGRADLPVASGAPPRDPPDYRGQMQYGLRPAFRKRSAKESAVEFLYGRLKANPGEL